MYGDETIVNDLCSRKTRSGEFLRHPDMPDREDMIIYKVCVPCCPLLDMPNMHACLLGAELRANACSALL